MSRRAGKNTIWLPDSAQAGIATVIANRSRAGPRYLAASIRRSIDSPRPPIRRPTRGRTWWKRQTEAVKLGSRFFTRERPPPGAESQCRSDERLPVGLRSSGGTLSPWCPTPGRAADDERIQRLRCRRSEERPFSGTRCRPGDLPAESPHRPGSHGRGKREHHL